jgi:CRP-like cAMP-binding protein
MISVLPPVTRDPRRNQLLANLPPAELERWLPHLEPVELRLGQILFEAGIRPTHLYFPTTAILAIINVTEDGGSAESSIIGCEGLASVTVFMGGESSTERTVVLCAGNAIRVKAPFLLNEFNRAGHVLQLFLRYTQALITQMSQTVMCARHHSVEQQLCRLLLLLLDRSREQEIIMTHELIAAMLGVRREGITEAACRLQQMGVIRYRRGHIHVVNRQALERRSCECYAVVKREHDRLIPTPAQQQRPQLAAVS